MPDPVRNFWNKGIVLAQEQIQATVRTRYFPEIWYILENWFQTVKGRQVLEVGYGIGLIGPALAKSGWQVACIDPSTKTLAGLSERFAKQHLRGDFIQSELANLPFASHSMDAVVAVNSLEFSPSPLATLREVARVLRPQGRAVVVTLNRHGPWGMQKIAELIGASSRPANRLMTKTEFRALITAANLHAAQILERAAYLPVPLPFKMASPLPGAFIALIKNHAPSPKGSKTVPPIAGSKTIPPASDGPASNPKR